MEDILTRADRFYGYIYGIRGSGKSIAALYGAIRMASRDRKKVLWIRANDCKSMDVCTFTDRIKQVHKIGYEELKDMLNIRYGDAPSELLIILHGIEFNDALLTNLHEMANIAAADRVIFLTRHTWKTDIRRLEKARYKLFYCHPWDAENYKIALNCKEYATCVSKYVDLENFEMKYYVCGSRSDCLFHATIETATDISKSYLQQLLDITKEGNWMDSEEVVSFIKNPNIRDIRFYNGLLFDDFRHHLGLEGLLAIVPMVNRKRSDACDFCAEALFYTQLEQDKLRMRDEDEKLIRWHNLKVVNIHDLGEKRLRPGTWIKNQNKAKEFHAAYIAEKGLVRFVVLRTLQWQFSLQLVYIRDFVDMLKARHLLDTKSIEIYYCRPDEYVSMSLRISNLKDVNDYSALEKFGWPTNLDDFWDQVRMTRLSFKV